MAVAHFSAFDVLSTLGVLTIFRRAYDFSTCLRLLDVLTTFRRAYDFSTCSRLLDVLTTSRRALDFLDVLRASNLPLLSDSSVGIASQYILCRIPRQGGKTTPPLFSGWGLMDTAHPLLKGSSTLVPESTVYVCAYVRGGRKDLLILLAH